MNMKGNGLLDGLLQLGGGYLESQTQVKLAREQATLAASTANSSFAILQSQQTQMLMVGGLALVGLFIWRQG